MIDADNPSGLLLGARKDWQEHRRQDGDNGDDNQQFNQRETTSARAAGFAMPIRHLYFDAGLKRAIQEES